MSRLRRVRMTEAAAHLLARLLRKRVTASAGIKVIDTADHLHIELQGQTRHSAAFPRPADMRLVKLAPAGGFPGGPDAACSLLYDIHPKDATTFFSSQALATARPVEHRTFEKGRYLAAPLGSYGEAFLSSGTWHLVHAYGERKTTDVCTVGRK